MLFIYFTNFQKIDDEDYGGPMELTKEGFFTSFSLFLVCSNILKFLHFFWGGRGKLHILCKVGGEVTQGKISNT